MHPSHLFATLLVVLALATTAPAETAPATPPTKHAHSALVWETTQLEPRVALGQERVEAVFKFRNSGAKPVTITSVQSSCGCTTAQLVKPTYASEETGEIRAVFEVGDRVGPQQKTVTVITDDAPTATLLSLRVEIPEALSTDRRFLQWTRGTTLEKQVVAVKTAGPAVEIQNIDFDPTLVEAAVETLPGGGGYQLTVRPLPTAEPLRHTVQLHATVGGKPRTVPIYVFVR